MTVRYGLQALLRALKEDFVVFVTGVLGRSLAIAVAPVASGDSL